MNMILICVYFLENNFGVVCWPRFKKFFKIALNPFVEYLVSIFGRPYQMVITGENTVAHSSIRDHTVNYRYCVGIMLNLLWMIQGGSSAHELTLGVLRGKE